LKIPPCNAPVEEWQVLFEVARLRAERALARPVTHAVIVVAAITNKSSTANIAAAAEQAGLVPLHLALRTDLTPAMAPALTAAMMAEDLAPRLQAESE
jgi:siroheme synthase (precorrin-2 oxidase/ferrochelatase)